MSEVKICKTLGDFIEYLESHKIGIELCGQGNDKEAAMQDLKVQAFRQGVNCLLIKTQWPRHIKALGIWV